MVNNQLDRMVASESFEYGEHTIRIYVNIEHTFVWNQGKKYVRSVSAGAYNGEGEREVTNISSVVLNPDRPTLNLLEVILAKVGVADADALRDRKRSHLLPLEDQIEEAVRPVMEEVDTIYGFLGRTYDIDIEVGIDRVRHDVSWVDVESEIDRISHELGMDTEANQC